MRAFLTIFICLFLFNSNVYLQITIISDNYGTTSQNPISRTGWTADAALGSAWELRTSGASSGYSWTNPSVSASGGANVFSNLGTNNNTKTLIYDNSLSTVGYSSIKVRFGAIKTGTVPNLDVSFSTNGSNFTSAGTITLPTTWTAQIVDLPAAAEGVSNLRIRFSIAANNGSSNNFRIDDFHVIGTQPSCPQPNAPPTSFSPSTISNNSMDIAWTNGNGDNTLVVARASGAVNADPTSGSTYTANAAFGSGSQIGTGNFVIYNGTGSSVSVTNLVDNTVYHYAIYTYNSVDNCYNLTELTGNASTVGPEIQLQYPGTTNVACGFTLPFSNVNINNSSDISYNIRNLGASNLDVASLDITGTDADLYSVVSSHSFPIIITPGNTEVVTVRFTPTSGGSKSATLIIDNNDSTEDPCIVLLSGSGIVPPSYFRTKQSGTWSSTSTWETSLDNISWVNASSAPVASDLNVTIKSPHNVTISTSTSLDQTIIEAGSVLDVSSSITIADGIGDDLQVFGTLRSSASITTTGNIKVKNGGVYQHNVATGTTRIPTSTWESGSTCEIIGYTSGGSLTNAGYDQNFYNFTWNCASQATEQNLAGTLTSIAGDFIVQSTGTSNLRLIGGALTLTLAGNLNVNSGAILNLSGSNSQGRIDVSGNVIIDGTLTELGGGSGMIVFKGNMQSLSVNGTLNNTVNITVDNGSTVDILTDVIMPNNLTLTNGLIRLNNKNLTVLGSITGGSTVSYIQTNGSGLLKQNVSTTKLFPIGNSSYNPLNLSISNVTEIGARVLDGVYASGLTGGSISEKVVNRTWDIDATIANPLTLQVFWYSQDETANFDRSVCYVSHYTGSAWEGDTPGTASGSGLYSRSRVTTFLSPFAVGSLGVLPVEFISFDVIKKNSKSLLNFFTASETNNDYFTIERSGDGRSFDAIGEIKGVGNSTEEKHYEFTDENPLPGINYYRIKQTDFDGQYSYSEIRSVRHTGKGNVAISPRSTDGILDISTEMESYDVAVYSSAGQEVARFNALAGHQTVNIEALQAGIYFVKVMSGTESETVRVVKY